MLKIDILKNVKYTLHDFVQNIHMSVSQSNKPHFIDLLIGKDVERLL